MNVSDVLIRFIDKSDDVCCIHHMFTRYLRLKSVMSVTYLLWELVETQKSSIVIAMKSITELVLFK